MLILLIKLLVEHFVLHTLSAQKDDVCRVVGPLYVMVEGLCRRERKFITPAVRTTVVTCDVLAGRSTSGHYHAHTLRGGQGHVQPSMTTLVQRHTTDKTR